MFSLVSFDTGGFYVVDSKSIKSVKGEECTVKYKGGLYVAKIISKSDAKDCLFELKKQKLTELENNFQDSNLSSPTVAIKETLKRMSPTPSVLHASSSTTISQEVVVTSLKKYSLISFDTDDHYIVSSKAIQKRDGMKCVVKYNGGSYKAVIVSSSDEREELLETKSRIESQQIHLPNSDKQLYVKTKSGPQNQLLLSVSEDCAMRTRKSKIVSDSAADPSGPVARKSKLSPSKILDTTYVTTTTANKKQHASDCATTSRNLSTHYVQNFETASPELDEMDAPSDCAISIPSMNCDQNIKPTSSTYLAAYSQESTAKKIDPVPEENTSNCPSSPYANFLDSSWEKSSDNSSDDFECIETSDRLNTFKNSTAIDLLNKDKSLFLTKTFINSTETESASENRSQPIMDASSIKDYTPLNTTATKEETTVSEYIPDSTINNSSKNVSSSFTEIVPVATRIDKVIVPLSKEKSKKHFCMYCKTLQCAISRHIFAKHKSEKLVKQAMAFPKRSKERLNIIGEIRKQGDFIHNTCQDQNTGTLILPRRQRQCAKHKPDDYVCCHSCKGFYTKYAARSHFRKCLKTKNSRKNLIDGRKCTQFVHPVASSQLKTTILPVLRNDSITQAIRYDELAIRFANRLSEKLPHPHHHDQIRASLRLLGRFKIQLIKLAPEVVELKDIFKPFLFDKCIDALRITSQWDQQKGFATPAVATNLSSLIKKCAKMQANEFIKSQNDDMKKMCDDFLSLWVEETPTLIHKKAVEDRANKQRTKKRVLPSKEDIKKLYDYLRSKMLDYIAELKQGFNFNTWDDLVKATLSCIQVFNRRRAGEIERITIENYENKEQITDTIEDGHYETLSKDAIEFSKQYQRVTLRGKLGRTVSILLDPLSIEAVNIILENRKNAGVKNSNPYIFSAVGKSKPFYRACPLLRKFAIECKAKFPDSLRGTNLRKHIATHASLLNVEEATVDRLANFMGHHKDIHKSIYRIPVQVAEIASISKLLLSATGCPEDDKLEDSTDEDVVLQNDSGGENRNMVLDDLSDNSSSTQDSMLVKEQIKRRKIKRTKWTNEEVEAVKSKFGELSAMKNLPSLKECNDLIINNDCLRYRTPAQVKTWIDNQRRQGHRKHNSTFSVNSSTNTER
ncbi:uncharacterized protein [Musca autumnalis]|uniref:uncharacterized protein n=1 Tax=Musca autumnalis TaxID=221902 RepID=UPI003CF34D4D